ncbi:hypothetical protein B0J13DRAFT_653814, partial [Dactylonectria estremocensis]
TPFWQLADKDRHPIALSICIESRIHTLRSFYLLRHHKQPSWSFYLNPSRDVPWTSNDFWEFNENYMNITNLWLSYGRQLAQMKKLVLGMDAWHELENLEVFRLFGGIEIIQILLCDSLAPAEVLELQERIKFQLRNDDRFCSRVQLVDRAYKVRGEVK